MTKQAWCSSMYQARFQIGDMVRRQPFRWRHNGIPAVLCFVVAFALYLL